MRKGLMSVIAFALLVMATPVAYAQQLAASPPQVAATTNPYVGTWHGVIGTYPFKDSPQRTLVVTETGGRLACRWGKYSEVQTAASCSVENGILGITTGKGALVVLQVLGSRLEGSLTPVGSRDILPLSMGQTPLPAYQAAALQQNPPQTPPRVGDLDGKTCTGEVSNLGRSYYGAKSLVTLTFSAGKVVVRFATHNPYKPVVYGQVGRSYEFQILNARSGDWLWKMTPTPGDGYDLYGIDRFGGDVPTFGRVRC